jgi:hypothetical protein
MCGVGRVVKTVIKITLEFADNVGGLWYYSLNLTKGQLMTDLTYCENCQINMEDDFFDFRFEYPICLTCSPMYELFLEEAN